MAAELTTMAGGSTVNVPLGDAENVEFRGGNLYLGRDAPHSSSHRSTSSSKSVVSQSPNLITSECMAKNLFSFKVIPKSSLLYYTHYCVVSY